jgi:hypothetical protein
MVDFKSEPPAPDSMYVRTDDGRHYLCFKAGTHDLFHNGIVGAVEELVTRGMYPKRYLEYLIKHFEKGEYNPDEVFQFLSAPGKNKEEQEAMTHGNQLEELIELCMISKVKKRITLHVEPSRKFLEIYERGFWRHAEESKKKKGGPPSQIDVEKSVKSGASHGTRSKHSSSSSRVDGSQKSTSVAGSKKSHGSSKKSSKTGSNGMSIKPFKVPPAPPSPKKLRSPEWHCIRIDPLGSAVKVDPKTNCISPWYASKPDEAKMVKSRPLPARAQYNDAKSYLTFLCSNPYDKKEMEKVLYQSFPAFNVPSGTTATDVLLPYLEMAITKFAAVGIYAPPLQTLSANDSRGAWFKYMNVKLQGTVSEQLQHCDYPVPEELQDEAFK